MDATASGAEEIGEAMQRVASSAENSNISLEKSASWIATISSITRESASTIGRSLNSMISRYESIKKTGFNSEDETKLNDVIQAMSQIGIKATDSQGQLIDFATALDLVAEKYPSLTKNEKSYITTTMFGTFQRNRGITLLNNYSQSLENYENALQSAGSTEEKFNIYQESTQSYLDKLRSTIESIQKNTFDSQGLKDAISILTSLFDTLDTIIERFGFLAPVVFAGSTAFLTFSDTGKKLKGIVLALITSLKTFNTTTMTTTKFAEILGTAFNVTRIKAIALQATLSLGLSLAITALVEGINKLIGNYQDLNVSQEDTIKNQANEVIQVSKLVSEMEELQNATKLSAEQKDRLVQIEQQLAEILPKATTGYDEQNIALAENLDIVKQLNEEKKKQLLGESSAVVAEMEPKINETIAKLEELKRKRDEMQEYLNNERLKPADKRYFEDGIFVLTEEEYGAKLKEIVDEISNLTTEVDKYNTAASNMGIIQGDLNKLTVEASDKWASSLSKVSGYTEKIEEVTQSSSDFSNLQTDLLNKFKETAGEVSTLNQLYADLKDGKALTADQALELIKNEESLIDALSVENGQIHINIEAVEALIEAKGNGFDIMIKQKQAEVDAEVQSTIAIINQYDKKIQAVKSYADAQIALQSVISSMVDEKGVPMAGVMDVTGKLYSRMSGILKAQETINKLKGLAGASFKPGGVGTKSSSSGSKGSSSKSEKDPYVTDKFAQSLSYLDTKLSQVNGRLSQVNETSDEYRKLQNENIYLLTRKRDLYESEAQKIREQLKNQKLSAEEIDNLKEKLNQYSSAWWDVQQSIDSASKAIEDSLVKVREEQTKLLTDKFDSYRTKILNNLDDEISRLEKKNDELKEEQTRKEKLLDIEKQREKVANMEREKNQRLLTKNASGRYEWTWVSDPQLAEEQEKLKEMQEDYNNWEDDLVYQKKMDKLKEVRDFINQEFQINENNRIPNMNKIYNLLGDVSNKYFEREIEKVIDFVDDWNNQIGKVESIGSKSTNNSTNSNLPSSGKGSASNEKKYLNNLISQAEKTGNSGLKKWAQNELKKYADGGINTETGIAWLDGTPSKPEAIFNTAQLNNLFKFLNSPFKYSVPNPKLPSFGGNNNTSNTSNNTTIKIEKVQTNDSRKFLTNLQRLVNA